MHEVVQFLFDEIEFEGISMRRMEALSEVPRQTMNAWRRGRSPSLDKVDQALRAIGYKLVVIPDENNS